MALLSYRYQRNWCYGRHKNAHKITMAFAFITGEFITNEIFPALPSKNTKTKEVMDGLILEISRRFEYLENLIEQHNNFNWWKKVC